MMTGRLEDDVGHEAIESAMILVASSGPMLQAIAKKVVEEEIFVILVAKCVTDQAKKTVIETTQQSVLAALPSPLLLLGDLSSSEEE